MPILPRPRISCFYCGRKSQHRRGDGIRSFRCSECEGTNYLDQDGNIADVPTQVVEHHNQTPPKQVNISKRQVHCASPPNDTFCGRCINNQQIVNNCIANYFPPDSDPKYTEFVAGFAKYKAGLEKRYPQVCPQCEAKVRERLKRNTYLAQSDSLSKKLASSRVSLSSQSQSWYSLDTVILASETVWRACLLVQLLWHTVCAFGLLDSSADPGGLPEASSWLSGIPTTAKALSTASPRIIFLTLIPSTLLLWWNPTLSHGGRLSVSKMFFYAFQTVMLAFRWLFWMITGPDVLTLRPAQMKGVHFIAAILILFTMSSSYRFLTKSPRYRIQQRNLNAPLVDPDSFPASEPIVQSQSSTAPAFHIQNLKASTIRSSNASDPFGNSHTFLPTPPLDGIPYQERQPADAMDWEPTAPTFDLKPRHFASSTAQSSASHFPSSSAFGAFPPPPGLNPFHGSLPPAPKSMEAKLRSDARKPPPQFKPTSDAKQADWFKRMSLAQSATGWNGKEYVHTVRQEDELPDLAPGKLSLGMFGGSRSVDTGLEHMFGTAFNINDREASPVKEDSPVPAKGAKWDFRVAIALIVILPIVAAFLLRPGTQWGDMKAQWTEKLLRFAYGHTPTTEDLYEDALLEEWE